MAAFTPTPLLAPAGWKLHAFLFDLRLEVQAHRTALLTTCLFLLLLVVARAFMPASERSRMRAALITLVFYLLSLPVRAELLALGLESSYTAVKVLATVLLACAVISVCGMLVFDLVGTRLGLPKLLRDVTIVVVSMVTVGVLLSQAGWNLLSIITTSAVVTAVIGLALQDTLGNLVSGVALQLESSVAIGDWIRIDDRAVGKVRQIRWRSTLIETKSADLVVIPNAMVAKGIITNFNKSGQEHRQAVNFHVHLRHPPNQVQQVAVAAVAGVPNISAVPPPECIFEAIEASCARYALRYRLRDFSPDDRTDSEVRKRLWYALKRCELEIAYPAQNVFITELTAKREQDKSEREKARRLVALARVGFLAPLQDEEREHLAARLTHAVYGEGEVILCAGEAGDSLYLVRSGSVAVRIGVDGLEREVATLKEGEFFGEMGLMTGEPRRATVVAKTDAACYVIDRALFAEVLEKKSGLVEEIGKLLAERQLELQVERDELSAEAARQHLAAHHASLVTRIRRFFGMQVMRDVSH